MAYSLMPDDRCLVTRNVLVERRPAFREGDIVVIVDVDADPAAPGRKYVVFSPALGRYVRLTGAELRRMGCAACGARLMGEALECPQCGWTSPEHEAEELRKESRRFEERMRKRRSGGVWPF